MKELSLNILDIAENSVKAEATLTEILIDETDETQEAILNDLPAGYMNFFIESVETNIGFYYFYKS